MIFNDYTFKKGNQKMSTETTEGKIPQAIKALSYDLHTLEQSYEKLSERLAPVLSARTEDSSMEGAPKPEGVSILGDLDGLRAHVERLIVRAREDIARLDI